ncbi:MAG TPA: FecR domain-containing protein [Pseudobacter sp.]|nr:FecR domain-containing protein [Pseudobacter sp.]
MEEPIRQLLNKYLQGQMTLKERLDLNRLINDPASKEELLSFIGEQYSAEHALPGSLSQEEYDAVFARVLVDDLPAPMEERTTGFRIAYLRKWWAAASVLVITVATLYFWLKAPDEVKPVDVAVQSENIQPGKEGALLTLADGSKVSLDTVRNGVIAMQDGVTARVVDGVLQYNGKSTGMVFNTMSTPRGRQFHLTLPDGTGVWLNAASSIRYPVAFDARERKVEVTGEVYFEVMKNKQHPFIVNVNNRMEVEVLGTDFNINAYDNESAIAATLLSGSIKVIKSDVADQLVLKPGQQALMNNAATAQHGIQLVPDADIEKVTAWRKGLFNFRDIPFDEAMRQLQRWYDIEVVYENGVPDIELMGEMTKGVSLNGLLLGLGKLGLNYRLEGRKLIILP